MISEVNKRTYKAFAFSVNNLEVSCHKEKTNSDIFHKSWLSRLKEGTHRPQCLSLEEKISTVLKAFRYIPAWSSFPGYSNYPRYTLLSTAWFLQILLAKLYVAQISLSLNTWNYFTVPVFDSQI